MNETASRMNRRLMTLILIVAAFFLAAAPHPSSAAEAGFKDVPPTHWAYEAVHRAADEGWVDGYSDGTFRLTQRVTEAEFLKLLLSAAIPDELPARQAGEVWSAPYYKYAEERNFPLSGAGASFDRGGAAQLIAALKGLILGRTEAVRYLLDNGLSSGITSATVEGYQMQKALSRAEAVQFIVNALGGAANAEPQPEASAGYSLRGIAIGDSEATVAAKLGKPSRVDPSEYGFQWHVYNDDYKQYAQIGIGGGKVVALFSNANVWRSGDGLGIGSATAAIEAKLGKPRSLTELDTNVFIRAAKETYPSYEVDGSYLTFIVDHHNGGKTMGMYMIERKTAAARKGSYGVVTPSLLTAYERELLDLANVSRVLAGKKALAWDAKIAGTARDHSKDMGQNGFFDHVNPQGRSPFDRMKADGIAYSAAAENIAAGQINAIFAHAEWMNSEGHRSNILGDKYERLGVGIAYSDDYEYRIYYTQNFYTPRG
ncbi:uncharacterized protein YkwD [Cohnella sp. SGD-V74]|uniref:CAP-associated domain-containing protein n=1 Tax=unclassified Cohnella TaxID=2636738 RepID=UPI000D48CA93|nr:MULTISPECIES: CAP-associated domain-containing protein [unclassified Cohnella]PRX70766.1 uncharacterized protein YkwD [Cohnella sp. SGD-V74]